MPVAHDGRVRPVITNVTPQIDCGCVPVKRIRGDCVVVEADIYADSDDVLDCRLVYRPPGAVDWCDVPMKAIGSDRWRAEFQADAVGRYVFTIEAWTDPLRTWLARTVRKATTGLDVAADLKNGVHMLRDAAQRAGDHNAARLGAFAARLESIAADARELPLGVPDDFACVAAECIDRRHRARYRELAIVVDRERARFSAWYEMFPRSSAGQPGRHGTFRDCEAWLPYIAGMGFDVLYLPPIHPIGRVNRRGPNNEVPRGAHDVGSPWAIGASEGGHTAVHPCLGTIADFEHLVARAADFDIEIALDIALQCAPDHPWVNEHPEWFRMRADGSIQHAENPPKQYEDIYPLDFDTNDWTRLWEHLKDVFLFWIDRGIRLFRVDNPHTKPFRFWEWVIAEVKAAHPGVLFLSEAFTRPAVMHRLAMLGFSQSYTYFTWRNTKAEITSYFTELSLPEVRDYFRASLWPSTPDILPEYLQCGGRSAFITRLVLAATLGASYGIYGPAFELCEHVTLEPGSEEYLNSEKYQIRCHDLESEFSLRDIITTLNRARRDNSALQRDDRLHFHEIDNDNLLCYSKASPDFSNVVLTVVNLDPHHAHSGWLTLDRRALGLKAQETCHVAEIFGGVHALWSGARTYVTIDPTDFPARLFVMRSRARTERDFDYYVPVASDAAKRRNANEAPSDTPAR